MPSVVAVLINLVLHGNLGQVGDDVLDLRISLAALGTSKVGQPGHLVQEVVGDGADDDNTDGETPNNADSDDGGLAVLGEKGVLGAWVGRLSSSITQPTEDSEESSENIDTEDGANELPRRPCLVTTGDEDEPILSERHLQEEHTLDGTEVVDHTTVWHEERATENPGTKSKFNTENDGDDPDFW